MLSGTPFYSRHLVVEPASDIIYYALNGANEIDVFGLEATDKIRNPLKIADPNFPSLGAFAAANLVYTLGVTQLKRDPMQTVLPGSSYITDQEIIAYMSTRLSSNIIQPTVVLKALQQGWNEVICFFGTPASTGIFTYHSDFKGSITQLIYQVLQGITIDNTVQMSTILHFHELMSSTFEGRPYMFNPYIQLHSLKNSLRLCENNDHIVALEASIIQMFNTVYPACYLSLQPLIRSEMEKNSRGHLSKLLKMNYKNDGAALLEALPFLRKLLDPKNSELKKYTQGASTFQVEQFVGATILLEILRINQQSLADFSHETQVCETATDSVFSGKYYTPTFEVHELSARLNLGNIAVTPSPTARADQKDRAAEWRQVIEAGYKN